MASGSNILFTGAFLLVGSWVDLDASHLLVKIGKERLSQKLTE